MSDLTKTGRLNRMRDGEKRYFISVPSDCYDTLESVLTGEKSPSFILSRDQAEFIATSLADMLDEDELD